jgi:tRNA (guanine-N7-)-methyltransferase
MKPHYLSLNPFIPWMEESHPIEWQKKFRRVAELEVEIGFGLGDFLVRRARAHPHKDFLGIELGWILVRRALRKISLAGVKNVRIVRADVRVAFERFFLDKSLQNVYALFPCPWPKKRHVKHRLFSNTFLRLINSRITDDGQLLIVTDSRLYFDWILSQLPGTGFESFSEMISPRFFTKYERKWYALGQEKFFELKLIKRRHIKIPPKEGLNLITYRVDRFDPGRFQPSSGHHGHIIVAFKETLYDPKQQKAMVRSVVGEDNLVQDFWIEIVKKERLWHIRPARGCGIIPTLGVQRALDRIYDATNR